MRGYKIVMSTGEEVKIDHEEIEVVMLGAQVKGMIRVKQGIVNPSFIVSVLPDKDRKDVLYDGGSVAEMTPLTDFFNNYKLIQRSDEMESIGDVLKK